MKRTLIFVCALLVVATAVEVVPHEEKQEQQDGTTDSCSQHTGFRVHVKPHFALCCENQDPCKVKHQQQDRKARGETPELHKGGDGCEQVMGFKVNVDSKYDLACQQQDPCKGQQQQEHETKKKDQQQQQPKKQQDPCKELMQQQQQECQELKSKLHDVCDEEHAEVVPRDIAEKAEAGDTDSCSQHTGFRVHVKPHFALCCENQDPCKVKHQQQDRKARGETPELHKGGDGCEQVMGFKVNVDSKYDLACQQQDPCKGQQQQDPCKDKDQQQQEPACEPKPKDECDQEAMAEKKILDAAKKVVC